MKSQKYFFCYVNYLTDLTVFEMYVMLTNAHEAKCIFLHFFSSFLNFFFYKFVQKKEISKHLFHSVSNLTVFKM